LAVFSFTKIKDIQISDNSSTNLITPYMEVKPTPGSTDPFNGKRSVLLPNTKII
jgi:hypothetical protein